ncbi:MAG TPA: MarR family transcriptional regulator [Anaerolineae bacterium]|nr:MarR family transcriptional regulator [Anaerolineae bacterium]
MSEETFVAALGEWIEVLMHYSMRRFLRHARERGLSMSHLGAIFHTHRAGGRGVTEIGEHLGVSSAAASQMLDRMVQQDLVMRSEDPKDRRVKRIVLTEKGQRILEECIRARRSWLNEVAGVFSDDEKQTIASALMLLTERVSQLSDTNNAMREFNP